MRLFILVRNPNIGLEGERGRVSSLCEEEEKERGKRVVPVSGLIGEFRNHGSVGLGFGDSSTVDDEVLPVFPERKKALSKSIDASRMA